MGINGDIVRSVFSRTRSSASSGTSSHHHGNGRSNGGEKKRWSVVRSYLCGDEEFNSVQGEEDSASVKSSAATVSRFPPVDDSVVTDEMMIKEGDAVEEEHNSTSSLFLQEDAAIIIQTAFRKARRGDEEEAKIKDDDKQQQHLEMGSESPGRYSVSTSIEVQTGNSVDVHSIAEEANIMDDDKQEQHPEMGSESPGRYSVSTSIEVQTGNSVDVLSIAEGNNGDQCKTQKKASRCQDFRSKEDWDDSTLSSNVLKMRIQNRLEATNRRERALAYALSQQLRICSKKKQARSECTQQPSTSWHRLERWMAARAPDFSFESHSSNQFEQQPNNNSHRDDAIGKTRCFDLAVEERESCGSNEVPLQAESSTTDAGFESGSFTVTRKKAKPVRSISRRKTVPSFQCPPKEQKTLKKSCASLEHEKEQKLKGSNSHRETNCKDASASYNHGNMHFLVN